jgi:PIN domain nuclease of toxin-antitoxin system
MNLLLDTHAFLWFIVNDNRLSARALALVASPANRRFLSIASVWEMAIKLSLGKLTVAQPLAQFLSQQLPRNRIELLEITLEHAVAVATLPFHHRDPFDRLLAAQCQAGNLPIVSHDSIFDAYSVQRLW